MSMHGCDVWAFAGNAIPDLTGFKVEARDGAIGKVDVGAATIEGRPGYLVVDTGPWIFGKMLLPVGVLRGVDADTGTAYVDLTKDEIKNAPEFDEDRRAAEHPTQRFSRDHDS